MDNITLHDLGMIAIKHEFEIIRIDRMDRFDALLHEAQMVAGNIALVDRFNEYADIVCFGLQNWAIFPKKM